MICPDCGSDVLEDFRFCGNCGRAMSLEASERTQAAAEDSSGAPENVYEMPVNRWESAPSAEPAPPEYERRETGISGPSFLGLSGGEDARDDSAYSYLLEEPPRRRHTGVFIAAVVLVVVAGVAIVKRHGIRESLTSSGPPASATRTEEQPQAAAAGELKPPDAPPAANHAGPPQMIVEETKKTGPPPTPPLAAAPATPQPATTEAKAAPEPAPAPDVPAAQPSRAEHQPSKEPQITATVTDAKPAVPAARVRHKEPKEEPGTRLLTAGEKYLYGRGVARNCDQAVVYLKAAANVGNAEARSHLGALYSAGECVPRDRVAAYHWFTLARKAKPESPWLESNLNMLWRDMSTAERRRVGAQR